MDTQKKRVSLLILFLNVTADRSWTISESDTEFDLHLHQQQRTCAKAEPPLGGGKEAPEGLGLTCWSLIAVI